MDRFKEALKEEKLGAMLTYADNFAVGFFKKIEFIPHNKMKEEQFHNYMKN